MKLRKFIHNLNQLIKERPEALEFEVVTSKDDEGNGYDLVYFTPTIGHYNSEEKEFSAEEVINAICIN